jgi:phosphoenolpyruvate carboxylase
VVLFDTIEGSAFNKLKELENDLSIEDYINIASNKNKKNLYKKLLEFSIRLVFTAHPTQFYSHSILDIINKLRSSIRDNYITSTDKIIQQLGLTSLINTEKPTPLDEAKKHYLLFTQRLL